MEVSLFKNSPSGKLVPTLDKYRAFVPSSLPPNLEWDASFASLISQADHTLGTLSGLGENLPNPHLLIYPFIRREAVLSSRIEGTQSSFSDLLLFEATEQRIQKQQDVREVQNYVNAMEYGLKRLETLPVSLRLIREIHEILMEGVRGEYAKPGEFRSEQNWIGNFKCSIEEASFVPPPVSEMHGTLGKLEEFIHSSVDLPQLVQLALIHYQFEAIHPFLDGNGRIGRLLITLFLCERRLMLKPLLYISAFFEHNRQRYYGLLLEVSQKGAWRPWIEFFLNGVIEQSTDAVERSRLLLELEESYRNLVRKSKMPPTTQKLGELIFERPILSAKLVQGKMGITWDGAMKAIGNLIELGILTETTGAKRNRIYEAREILKILE